ncbi:MAG: S-adenosylmethionine:tRNA ribosyltransferase-isomerase, partial [Muribaculaceae bacterium]|nr:S-adenosylmethionine:tRNA ribosyltransferase-isomerase [Muribaculaceae bacterium]
IFSELPSMLPPGAMLVYNNTRVINARLRFTKATGAAIEIFCLEPHTPSDYEQAFAARSQCRWQCLVGNSKKWKEGALEMRIDTPVGTTVLRAERLPVPPAADKSQTIAFEWDNPALSFSDIISAVGEIPIPPYLNRKSEASDSTDYQTVYSHIDGSVAAPTAGLHFTDALLRRLDEAGIERREVTLHVGAGTFRPVKADRIGDHDMHSEFIAVDRQFIADLADAIAAGRPVVAVGTTSVRTLESLYHIGCLMEAGMWTGELPQWTPYETQTARPDTVTALRTITASLDRDGDSTLVARTRIIIAPGYTYRIADAMITNFHQPQSTLLLLVSAFLGDSWRNIYDHAVDTGYRFLSYGDACLFFKHQKS